MTPEGKFFYGIWLGVPALVIVLIVLIFSSPGFARLITRLLTF